MSGVESLGLCQLCPGSCEIAFLRKRARLRHELLDERSRFQAFLGFASQALRFFVCQIEPKHFISQFDCRLEIARIHSPPRRRQFFCSGSLEGSRGGSELSSSGQELFGGLKEGIHLQKKLASRGDVSGLSLPGEIFEMFEGCQNTGADLREKTGTPRVYGFSIAHHSAPSRRKL